MKIDRNGLVYALTYALDCIEAELIGVETDHAKWVAYLSILLGRAHGLPPRSLADLAACAALHDNALTQYLREEGGKAITANLGLHCTLGEDNLRNFPFYDPDEIVGCLLYHHENADGSGPFGKKAGEVPFGAEIIHLADKLDIFCRGRQITPAQYDRICAYCRDQCGRFFSPTLLQTLERALPRGQYLALAGREIDDLLMEALPHRVEEMPFAQVRRMMEMFGQIVDYKSPFTRNHSDQIARRAQRMANYYGYDTATAERLYVAGALHDIGKMAITNDVLEKPDRLTETEYAYMQNHAWYTYQILRKIDGFEDITEWASYHHEKLNGRGYPFGKTAAQLSKNDRLLACLDIYQALREDRPYKPGKPHAKCIAIMQSMVEGGFIDGAITNDIDKVFGEQPQTQQT